MNKYGGMGKAFYKENDEDIDANIRETQDMAAICVPFILFSTIYIIVNYGYLFTMHILSPTAKLMNQTFRSLYLTF